MRFISLSFTSAAEHRIGGKSFGGKHLANECNLLIISSPVARQIQHLPQVCQQDSPQDSPQPSLIFLPPPSPEWIIYIMDNVRGLIPLEVGPAQSFYYSFYFPPQSSTGDIIYNQWDLGLYFASHC